MRKNVIKKTWLVLLAGLVLLVLQHRLVGLYYDDFGNTSLSYGYMAEGVEGTNWTVSDLLGWVRWCYFNWGGRVLYAAMFLLPLTRFGALPYMLCQVVVLLLIFWFSVRFVNLETDKQDNFKILLLFLILYGLLGQDVHRFGTYWASASVLYVWPMLPLFMSAFLYGKKEMLQKQGLKNEWKWNLLLLILVFFATFSQEQVGAFVVVYYVFMALIGHWKVWKEHWKTDVTVVGGSVVSYLVLFFAPGNFARLNSTEFAQLSLIEKFKYNYPQIVRGFFIYGLSWMNLVLTLLLLYASVRLYKESKKAIILVVLSVCSAIFSLYKLTGISLLPEITELFCETVVMLNLIVTVTIYMAMKKRISMIAMMYAGGASVVCLLVSPTVNIRSYLGYIFAAFIIIASLFADWSCDMAQMKRQKYICVAIGLLGLFSFRNYYNIERGYSRNYENLMYNDKVLREYENEEMLILKKLPESYYAVQMPYDEGFGYIEYWMKEYYDIPENVKFIWVTL